MYDISNDEAAIGLSVFATHGLACLFPTLMIQITGTVLLTCLHYCLQSIDFFGALRARVYDDAIRTFLESTGFENMGKRMINNRESIEFAKPSMDVVCLFVCFVPCASHRCHIPKLSSSQSPNQIPIVLCYYSYSFCDECHLCLASDLACTGQQQILYGSSPCFTSS